MSEAPLTILAIFAHPDDEIGVGSTLAYYSDNGVFTILACASRGEAATIYCDDCATPENLADVRTHELECSCRNLNIAELRWLDWPDGGIASLPRARSVGQIVGLIREFQPDVVLTHPENGLYPHPDHLAIWEMVRAAYDAAADLGAYPRAGKPWSVARLYTRALPQSYFDRAPEFAAARVELNGRLLPFIPTPDEDVNVTMHVAQWAAQRLAAWDCHRSQDNPAGAFVFMPADLRKMQVENEYFVLAAARVPLPEGVSDDLLAGLQPGAAPGEAGQPEETAEADTAGVLRAALSARRGYLAVSEEYLRQNPKANFQELLRALRDREQEMIYLLAGELRRAEEAPGRVEPDARLLAQAMTCSTTQARSRYLRVGAARSAKLYRARAASGVSTEGAAGGAPFWEELARLAEAQLATITAFRD